MKFTDLRDQQLTKDAVNFPFATRKELNVVSNANFSCIKISSLL